nr:F57 [uncultured bacterium]
MAGHGIAGARSRKALTASGRTSALVAAVCQIVLLVAVYGLMTVKPF